MSAEHEEQQTIQECEFLAQTWFEELDKYVQDKGGWGAAGGIGLAAATLLIQKAGLRCGLTEPAAIGAGVSEALQAQRDGQEAVKPRGVH